MTDNMKKMRRAAPATPPSWVGKWFPWTAEKIGNTSVCGCCTFDDAVTPDRVWQCCHSVSDWWQLYPDSVVPWSRRRNYAHPDWECLGNCKFHPLLAIESICWARLNELDDEEEAADFAALPAEVRHGRLAEEEALRAAAAKEEELRHATMRREIYAEDVKQRTRRGLTRNEVPKTLVAPCKWVIGEFKGDECWAWEYTDPKTGKRVCPHTCNRLHPGQAGWHNEWFSNRNWKPATSTLQPVNARFSGGRSTPAPPPLPLRAPPRPAPAARSRWALPESEDSEGLDAW
uniref:Uncharacterized protein n=1 Tax=viral metagenome TaxID=1070528 RepID=A0A6C0K9P5_9ZZZZ